MISWQRIYTITTNYIISFFELQFVISLMSLPLLIAWGLPVSIMSPFANFIFTPLLILFLWCSCLATICALAHAPFTMFERALNATSNLWIYILSFSKPSWLIGFPQTMLWLSILICIGIIALYTYIKPTAKNCALILGSLWLIMIAIQPYFALTHGLKKIGDLPLWITRIQNKTYLIDRGALCNRKNMFTNFDYTVLPELIKNTGHTTVDTVIFCKPSNKITKIAQQCHDQLNCSTIMVTPNGNSFQKVQEHFIDTKIKVLPLNKKKTVVFDEKKASIS